MGDVLRHAPVLRTTVLDTLAPVSGDTVLDVTLGLGGHAQAFLERIGPAGTLIGLDADKENLAHATERLAPWKEHCTVVHANFSEIASLKFPPVDILFADLGLSSPHVDEASRGFSFRLDGPLDLRYDRSTGRAASSLIEQSDADAVGRIFAEYGEMRGSFRLARQIAGKRVETTSALKAEVEKAFGFRAPSLLPQVFQALRIAVNDELGALHALLQDGLALLSAGGRMGIISYHSLEDRIVKHLFRSLSTPPRDELTGKITQHAPYELLTRKPLIPSPGEIAENPRSRSAKFRAIRRATP